MLLICLIEKSLHVLLIIALGDDAGCRAGDDDDDEHEMDKWLNFIIFVRASFHNRRRPTLV